MIWLVAGGLVGIYLFFWWEAPVARRGGEPLVRPAMLHNHQLVGGLSMFFFQYFIQAGVFFTIPLFLSVVLELSALQTGARLLPLSFALLAAAVLIPKWAPRARPAPGRPPRPAVDGRRDAGPHRRHQPWADAGIVAVPMLLIGLGIGALASQLGAITVSAVPDEQSAEVGGLQNTVTNLGASLGTALVGAVLIANLTTGLLNGVQASSALPADVKTQATTQFAAGVPFISDPDLDAQLSRPASRPTKPPPSSKRIATPASPPCGPHYGSSYSLPSSPCSSADLSPSSRSVAPHRKPRTRWRPTAADPELEDPVVT